MRSRATEWLVVLSAAASFSLGWVTAPEETCLTPDALARQIDAVGAALDELVPLAEAALRWLAGLLTLSPGP